MPRLSARPRRRPPQRAVVVGDLVLDVTVGPARPPATATDVPGRVTFRQGGSAATTARWLARLGLRVTLVCSVGRDAVGRSLVAAVRTDGVLVRAVRPPGAPTGRVGVLLEPGGERSFVADRGAADLVRVEDLREGWFAGCRVLHLPAYSLVPEPLGSAARAAILFARQAGAIVSLDLASSGPLLASGRAAALATVLAAAPDLLFASSTDLEPLLEGRPLEELLRLAPLVVVKRGSGGATILVADDSGRQRFDVATRPLAVSDSTGAGDAFDAGFLAAWLPATAHGAAGRQGRTLRQSALAGHRAATRHLQSIRPELDIR